MSFKSKGWCYNDGHTDNIQHFDIATSNLNVFPCKFFWNIVWKVAVDFLYFYHMPKIDPFELGLEMMLLNWQIQAAHMYFDVEFVHSFIESSK